MAALVDRHLKEGIKCKIFAFDKNPQRAQLLKNRMQAAGAQHIVQVSNEDFLSVDVHSSKYKDVTCILLDPSCSGSGVARVLERVIERQSGSEANIPVDARLDKLRAFQIAALRKAMSFPAVEYVVYSTCSIHIEENESVVSEVLTATSEELPIDSTGPPSSPSSWSVAEPKRLSKWTRRGLPFEGLPLEMQQRLIRCQPSDGLNGFFVAVMQKCVSHDTVPTQGMEQAGVGEVVMDTVIEMPHTGPSEGTSTAVDSFRDVIRRIKPDENYPEAPFFASMAASLPSKTFNSMYRPVGKFRRLKRVSKRHSTLWRPLSFSVHF